MEKSVGVHLLILIWTIFACLVLPSSAGRGAQWNRNDEPEEKKSIICYKCNSANDPNCGDPFEPYTLGVVNCSLVPKPEHLDQNVTATICRKSVQKVYGKIRIVRDCGYIEDSNTDKECLKRSGTHDVQVHYCSCSKSLCNGGQHVRGTPQLAALFVAMLATVLAFGSS